MQLLKETILVLEELIHLYAARPPYNKDNWPLLPIEEQEEEFIRAMNLLNKLKEL